MSSKLRSKMRTLMVMLLITALMIPSFGSAVFATDRVVNPSQLTADSPVSITVDNASMSFTEANTYTFTIKVLDSYLGETKPLDWYNTTSLQMVRESAYLDEGLYPNWYKGDKMKNWEVMNISAPKASEKYFTFADAEVTEQKDGITTITQKVSTSYLFKDGDNFIKNSDSRSLRNVWQSFVGNYFIDLLDKDDKIQVSTSVMFSPYKGHVERQDVAAKIKEIKASAINGRYVTSGVFGKSEYGYDQHYIIIAKNKKAVTNLQSYIDKEEVNPNDLIKQIEAGKLDYKLPVMVNNVHSDETPGQDAILQFASKLASQETVKYSNITGFTSGNEVTPYWSKSLNSFLKGYGSIKIGDNHNKDNDVDDWYKTEELSFDVDETLNDIVYILTPSENPDGRSFNTRRNANGFDNNRDTCYQTQSETANIAKLIAKWNPIAFIEFHGFVQNFLIEPCTPPHEPNLEYDLMVEYFTKGGEAFGSSAIASNDMFIDSGIYDKNNEQNYVTSFEMPIRDYFDAETGWEAWDDLCSNYTPSYAMLNSYSYGYTVETPYGTQACTDLQEYGLYGISKFFVDNKDAIATNQLKAFNRGLKNIDAAAVREWYVDLMDNKLTDDSWREKYTENKNFFPEYYVIPIDSKMQRDTAEAYEMIQYLLDNDVRVKRLNKSVKVGKTTYKAGSYVIDMKQAKRNYANVVLYEGADASGYKGLYSESVTCFPELRGFTVKAITKANAFKNKTRNITKVNAKSILNGKSGKSVVMENNGAEAVRAVNAMLKAGDAVGLITAGTNKGNFLVSSNVFMKYKNNYTIVGTLVSKLPTAYRISKPKLYVPGEKAAYAGDSSWDEYKITEGYYSKWFRNGLGFINYANIQNPGTRNFDMMAYDKQLGFTIVSKPENADVVVGSNDIKSGMYGEKALELVKSGTPYIASGRGPLETIKTSVLEGTGFDYKSDGSSCETLHYITYPDANIATAPYVQDGDYITYSLGGSYITGIPEGSNTLIKVKSSSDFHIAGCYPDIRDSDFKGSVEAISYVKNGLDITVFANSTVNKAHQQDDYRYVSTAIYSKNLSSKKMTISARGKTVKGF